MVRRDRRNPSMTPKTPSPGRGLLVPCAALLLALTLSGCGRRGPLEPPEAAASSPQAQVTAPADPRLRRTRTTAGQAAAPSTTLATRPGAIVQDTPDDDDSDPEMIQSVIPTPNPTPRKRGQPYLVPNESFILDPLL
jgi:predicted small lipoprotein YifL